MKITKIQQIAIELDGKRFIEGKIERQKLTDADKRYELLKQTISDKVDAEYENEEWDNWKKDYQIGF